MLKISEKMVDFLIHLDLLIGYFPAHLLGAERLPT
jgi:hypothetical protein